MLAEMEKRLHYDDEYTSLPEASDEGKVQELVMELNEKVVREEL